MSTDKPTHRQRQSTVTNTKLSKLSDWTIYCVLKMICGSKNTLYMHLYPHKSFLRHQIFMYIRLVYRIHPNTATIAVVARADTNDENALSPNTDTSAK